MTAHRVLEITGRDRFAAVLPAAGRGLEIGVHEGRHALELMRHARPRVLHLADYWRRHPHDPGQWTRHYHTCRAAFREEIAAGRVILHEGNHRETLRHLPAASFDWCYVDAHHAYQHTRAALADAVRLTRIGGVIALHDFCVLPEARWRTGAVRPVLEALSLGLGPVLAITNAHYPEIAVRKTREITYEAAP